MVSSTKWKLPFCFASHTIKRPPKELSVLPFGDLQPHGEFTPCQKQGLFHWFRAELVFQKCLASHIFTCLLPLCHKKLLESLQWSPSCFPENNFFQNSTDIFRFSVYLKVSVQWCPCIMLFFLKKKFTSQDGDLWSLVRYWFSEIFFLSKNSRKKSELQ